MVVSEPSWMYSKLPSEFMVIEPLVGGLTIIDSNESRSTSVSFPVRVEEPESVIETVAASSTVKVSLTVIGRSFKGVISIVKVSNVLHVSPSLVRPYLSAK